MTCSGAVLARVWLVLLLLAGMGTARDLVLCIAPGEHVSVEAQHPGSGCAEAGTEQRSTARLAPDDAESEHCSDIPLLVRSATSANDHRLDAPSAIGVLVAAEPWPLRTSRPTSVALVVRAPHPQLGPLATVILQS